MNAVRSVGRAAGAVGVAGALVLVAAPASAEGTATPRLTRIICGGPFLPECGSYRDNVLVGAEEIR